MGASRRWPWASLAVGLGLRLAWCLYAARTPVGVHDPGLYRFLAERLVDGHGYSYANGPTAYYPPLLPFLLAGPLWLADLLPGVEDPATIGTVVLNLALSAAAIALAWRLGGLLGGGRAAAGAAVLLALWPNLVVHAALPLTETPTLVVVLGLAVLVVEAASPSPHRLLAIGAVLGLGLLLRPVLLPVLPALAVVWWRGGAGWAGALRRTAVVAAAAAVVCLPWVVRNAVQVDRVALTLNTGDNLCIGHQPGADGTFLPTEHCFPRTFDDLPRPDSEIEREEVNRRQAWEHLRGHLADEPEQVLRRGWATLEDDRDGLRAAESFGEDRFLPSWARSAIGWVSDGWYLAAVLAALVYLPRALRGGDRRRGAVLLLAAASVLAPLATFGEPRFKVPAVPLVCVLLAVGALGTRPGAAPATDGG